MTPAIRALFSNGTDALRAKEQLIAEGARFGDVTLEVAATRFAEDSQRESRTMIRIVVVIALASVIGTAIGAALGVALHLTVGPRGTSGLAVQIVSWAIFAHLLIGMCAGYLLLADRSEREIGRERPVNLTLHCANIDSNALVSRLRELGAIEVETGQKHPRANWRKSK